MASCKCVTLHVGGHTVPCGLVPPGLGGVGLDRRPGSWHPCCAPGAPPWSPNHVQGEPGQAKALMKLRSPERKGHSHPLPLPRGPVGRAAPTVTLSLKGAVLSLISAVGLIFQPHQPQRLLTRDPDVPDGIRQLGDLALSPAPCPAKLEAPFRVPQCPR